MYASCCLIERSAVHAPFGRNYYATQPTTVGLESFDRGSGELIDPPGPRQATDHLMSYVKTPKKGQADAFIVVVKDAMASALLERVMLFSRPPVHALLNYLKRVCLPVTERCRSM